MNTNQAPAMGKRGNPAEDLPENPTPVDYVKLGFQRFAQFEGRSSKAEYWWFILAGVIAGIIPVLGPILSLIFLVPNLAVLSRRLHDIDYAFKTFLIHWAMMMGAMVVSWSVLLVSVKLAFIPPLVGVVGGLTFGIYYILKLIQPGTIGPNQYGEDPLQAAAKKEVA